MQIVSRADAQPWVTARRQLTNANLATIYQRLGLYDRALDTYQRMRRISGWTLRPVEQAQVLANMGALYRRLGDPVKALEQYHAAQALYERSHLRSGEIAVLPDIGIAQVLDLNALPEALETFDKSVALETQSQDRPLLLQFPTIYRGCKKCRHTGRVGACADRLPYGSSACRVAPLGRGGMEGAVWSCSLRDAHSVITTATNGRLLKASRRTDRIASVRDRKCCIGSRLSNPQASGV